MGMMMEPPAMEDFAIVMTVPDMMPPKRTMEIGPQAAPGDPKELLCQIYKMLQCYFGDEECNGKPDEKPSAKPSKPFSGEKKDEPEEDTEEEQ